MACGLRSSIVLLVICTCAVVFGPVSSASFWGARRVDCGVSIWSRFDNNPDGSRTRTRQIIRNAQNGGAPCPHLNETEEINPWFNNTAMNNARRLRQTFLAGPPSDHSTIYPRDILFIVDSSGSVGRPDFDNATENIGKLISKICGSVGLDRLNNRVAAVTFSNQFSGFDFDDHSTLADVQTAIESLLYYGGSTHTAEALDYARTNIFKSYAGMRLESVKEVVILSDGMSNGPGNPIIAASTLSNALSPNIAVYTFFIGRWSQTGSDELEGMVSSPIQDHLFIFPNFKEFQVTVDIILTYDSGCAPITLGSG